MNKGKENRERVDIINRINKFLAMLILLNAADGFLTYVGVQSGYAIEANAIMVPVVTNPVKLFLFKILLPSVLMGLLSFITQKTKDKSLVRIERFIHALVWIYLGVLFLHAVWIWFAVYSIFR
jgi:hypothetical protein